MIWRYIIQLICGEKKIQKNWTPWPWELVIRRQFCRSRPIFGLFLHFFGYNSKMFDVNKDSIAYSESPWNEDFKDTQFVIVGQSYASQIWFQNLMSLFFPSYSFISPTVIVGPGNQGTLCHREMTLKHHSYHFVGRFGIYLHVI